jgi:hypothetical protein
MYLTLEEKDTQRGTMTKRKTNRLGCNATTNSYFLICLALFVLNIPFGQAQDEEAGRYQLRDGLRKGQGRAKGAERKTRLMLVDILKEAGSQTWDGWDETRELAAFFPPSGNTARNLIGKKSSRTSNKYYGIGAPVGKKSGKKSVKAPSRPLPKPTPSRGRPTNLPTAPPIGNLPTTPPTGNLPTTPPTGKPPIGGDRCQLPNLEFLQLTAVPPPIFVNPNDQNDQTLGTGYVYNDALFNQTTFDEVAGSKVTGTCTRVQSRDENAQQLILGAGHCTFTYKLFDGQNTFTFSATGELADSLGGVLDIIGGSQALAGAYGQIQLVPANLDNGNFVPEDGDVFLAPLFYLADATIFFPC